MLRPRCLEGLSIGRLAEHLGMSKSGLYAHFRSKEELQLATIRTAEATYEEALVEPALQEPAGIGRVLSFADRYVDYIRDGPFPGGCFFIAASIDPARNRGPVKAALAAAQAELLDFVAEEIATAQSLGEVPAGVAPRELAFAVDAFLTGRVLHEAQLFVELAPTSTSCSSTIPATSSSPRTPFAACWASRAGPLMTEQVHRASDRRRPRIGVDIGA